ncbi:MAG: VWA domain-containing protein [Candidatus Thiodiazotropha sp.]
MKLSLKSSAAALLILSSSSGMCASVADIAFVIDQSGSMGSEFNWLSSSIETINQRVSDAGITARYAVAGYERDFGSNGDDRNIYQDFSSDITDITNATTDVNTYGGNEYSYNAAVDGTTGFAWSDSAVRVMILITDERSPQSGDNYSESEVGDIMSDGDFLLNVIAPSRFQENWDDAAYSTDNYLGFFDLDLLRDDPETFTTRLTEAKIEEIINQPSPVPLPAAFWLFATGLLGLFGFKRNSRSTT